MQLSKLQLRQTFLLWVRDFKKSNGENPNLSLYEISDSKQYAAKFEELLKVVQKSKQ